MRQTKQLCKELICEIGMWTALMLVILVPVAFFIQVNPLAMALGVLVGGLTAAGLLLHMYRHLDIALDMSPDRAGRHTQFAAIQRMCIMAAVMAVAFLYSWILHPAGVAFGILGMKAAALAYPKLHACLFSKMRF